MPEPTEDTTAIAIENILIKAGVHAELEVALDRIDPGLKISEVPHAFRWMELEQAEGGAFYVQLDDGRYAFQAFEFAHHPSVGILFVLAIYPNTDDPDLNRRIPVRFVPVGIVNETTLTKAAEAIFEEFGQEVTIPRLSAEEWDPTVFERFDIPVDLTFEEKKKDAIVAFMPSGKKCELFGHGKERRGTKRGPKKLASRIPPLGVSVRCRVKFERLSRVIVTWTGKTTEEALAAGESAGMRAISTGVIAAVKKSKRELDPFQTLGLDGTKVTAKEIESKAEDLLLADLDTAEQIAADTVVVAMRADNNEFTSDAKSMKLREEYIELAVRKALYAVRNRQQAKVREDRKPASVAQPAPAEAPQAEAVGNGGGKPVYEKPFGPRMGLKRLLRVTADLGVELTDEAKGDKLKVLAALETKWLETHPQA